MCEREKTNQQSINLHKTLEKKKQIKELMKTDPEAATKQILDSLYKSSHRPMGISNVNRRKALPYRSSCCESCGSQEHLVCHHKNKDQSDNSPENIQTLCQRCHATLHWEERKQ